MTFLNNLLPNDYVFIPLFIGMVGIIGWSWWSEGTKNFTSVNNVATSPVSSWPYDWTANRVTDASLTPRSLDFSQSDLLKLQREAELETRLEVLDRVQQNTRLVIDKLEVLKLALIQRKSMVNPDLMIPDTSTHTSLEVVIRAAMKTQFMMDAVGLVQDAAGNWVLPF